VPLMVEDEGLDEYVMDRLGIADGAIPKADRSQRWRELVTRERSGSVEIALVGKYGLEDAYMSIHEALKHAGIERRTDVKVLWVDADEMAEEHAERMEAADGIIVPGGFGARGAKGKIDAVRYARENEIPFLGLCLGFQMAVIEQARNVLGLEGAHSAEIDADTPHPVIDILPEQKEIDDMGGTMRLGAHETQIDADTLAAEIYEADACTERHRHRYEVNPAYIEELESENMVFSGTSGRRMEILELDDHPFFIGTQFHPEFRSRPDRASPPFVSFLDAVIAHGEDDSGEPATEADNAADDTETEATI